MFGWTSTAPARKYHSLGRSRNSEEVLAKDVVHFPFQLVPATGIATSTPCFCRQEICCLQHRSRRQHPYTAQVLPQPASCHPFAAYISASLYLHLFVMSAGTASGNSSRMEPFQAYVNCRCHLLLRQVWNARHVCRNVQLAIKTPDDGFDRLSTLRIVHTAAFGIGNPAASPPALPERPGCGWYHEHERNNGDDDFWSQSHSLCYLSASE